MPVAMRTTYQKAEAKYNVTTDFPSLGLHSAAATGNVGLVEYALDHGQPINSVLDGVLPLHAACAGGNVQVVKLLIDHGADVNAPRLPRRYSNDKNRDSSAPIVGTSGSTPLHFAAANGNTEAVTLLLLHGAHANRSDKHGITPEILARQHGWLECADVLKQWLVNKDRDLRERPGGGVSDDSRGVGTSGTARERIGSFSGEGESQPPSTRRRIHVKHSIDNALNKLKSSTTDTKLHLPPSSTSVMTSTPPASPTRSFGEYTFHPISPSGDDAVEEGSRRPSLPQIFQPSVIGLSRSRKTSTPTINNSPSPRRPRSAGTGAEGQDEPTNPPPGRSGVRKLGSKYSLMNLFKKGQTGEAGPSVDSSQTMLNMSPPFSGSTSALPMSSSPNQPSPLSNPLSSTDSTTSSTGRSGFRFHRGSDASTRAASQQPPAQQPIPRKASATMASPPRPLAVDLHNALAQERQDRRERQTRDRSRSTGSGSRFSVEDNSNANISPGSSPLARLGLLRVQGHRRDRSGSGASLGTGPSPGYRGGAVFDDDVVVVAGEAGSGEPGKSIARPSILKAHTRTSSSGHVPGVQSGFRALRFDSSPGVNSAARREGDFEGIRVTPSLRGSTSAGSLGRRPDIIGSGSTPGPRVSEEDLTPDSAPAATGDFEGPVNNAQEEIIEDEDDDEYGEPLHRGDSPVVEPGVPELPHATLLLRERGLSFASSSQSSLSPIMSNDAQEPSLINADFPFSINKPPVMYSEDVEAVLPVQDLLRVPAPGENRSRGDSVSSTSTTDSRNNPQLSVSGTTSGSGSGSETVNTPWFSSPGRDQFLDVATDSSPGRQIEGLPMEDIQPPEPKYTNGNALTGAGSALNERRSHVPPDINISSISSHAQAEALVQKAQQDIIRMAQSNELTPVTGSTGRSPLSARLAAYGESLALERKAEGIDDLHFTQTSSNTEPPLRNGATTPTSTGPSRRSGMERQHSLEHRPIRPKSKSRMKDPKRPSTAEGLSPRSVDQGGRFHQPSRSASGFGASPTSRLSIDQDMMSPDEPGPTLIHSKSATLPTTRRDPSPAPRIVRSRTPLPDTGEGQLSRISSLECPDTDTELGPPLLRVSTAPYAPVRGAKTASKLARMGFPPMEQARASPTPPKRFGGAFKSLVQTLKGKP
ncbi:hypothetical protein FPV67DRAFT_1561538 [Lyophyllum atratum]|nr:hypothetical protein FPV67DRAFT_1561538 [Lyophyllum atratum]